MNNELLDAALSYAARGWPVHPCAGKRPYTQHWRDEASTDPEQIALWWKRWPNANIGLVTGRASGVYVVDADTDGAEDHLELAPTLTVYTGKGRHFYYAMPPDGLWPNTAKKLGANVDTRGDGGYVCAPPSMHENGKRYAWGEAGEAIAPLPDNVVALLKAKAVLPVLDTYRAPRMDIDTVECARRWVMKAEGAVSGQGGHDDTIRIASALVNGWALSRSEAEPIFYAWNETCSPPWSEKELTHKLDDAVKAGTYNGRERGCLIRERRETERREPAFDPVTGELSPYDQAIKDLTAAGFGAKLTDEVAPLAFSPTSALFDEEFPATPWQVRGLLTERSLMVVGGEPKTTKTWAALDLAMGVATGTAVFGELESMQGACGVALFMAEDSKRSTRNRLRALARCRGLDPRDACARVYAAYLQAIDLRALPQVAGLVVAIRAIPERVGLVVLDPLRDCHGAEENSSTEMAVVAHAMRALRTVCGVSVVFIHHMSKSGGGTTNGGRRAGVTLRGSSAMHGAVDCGLYLRDLKTDEQSWWTNKAEVQVKGARGAGSFSLTLTVEDEDDEAVGAQWAFDRTAQKAKEETEAAEKTTTMDAVVQLLREHMEKNLGASIPVSESIIRIGCGQKSDNVRAAIKEACELGVIRRVMGGKKSMGFVYVDVSQRGESDADPCGPE